MQRKKYILWTKFMGSDSTPMYETDDLREARNAYWFMLSQDFEDIELYRQGKRGKGIRIHLQKKPSTIWVPPGFYEEKDVEYFQADH